jgi:hypothetical protein
VASPALARDTTNDPFCTPELIGTEDLATTQIGGSVCGYQDLREELTTR